jgi:cell fate regulator YaaT (PSP1 superfamily)
MVYTVKFKRSQKNFVLNSHIIGDIKIGSYVKVEADRGEDLGIVLSRIPIEKFNSGSRINAQSMDVPQYQFKRITRLATDEEISLLNLKEEEEAELLKICKSKISQRGLPMNVVDAEYQFDRHKLTFFFEASCRVDFRELVRDLFSIYKTRIWMQQIDKMPSSPLSLNSVPSKGSRLGFEPHAAPLNGNIYNNYELGCPVANAGFAYKGDM